MRLAPASGRVLSAQHLVAAIVGEVLTAATAIPDAHIQPASLDLRLGATAYRLRCSFLPGPEDVETALADYKMEALDLRGGAVLERNRPYLIPLQESLNLPDHLAAKANPRSSTGRLDIFTRVVTDRSETFDEIAYGYRGRLYVEVVSRSFTIKVQEGLRLSQLRLLSGIPDLDDAALSATHLREPLLYAGSKPVPAADLQLGRGLFLSADLSGTAFGGSGDIIGFRARKNSHLLDLSKLDHYEPAQFWEAVEREAGNRVVLEPEDFYLLYSRERVRIPLDLAADMAPFDASAGEVRTHYAGFFDPGFGVHRERNPGAHAVLEVRAHEVPFAIADGQRLCKLVFQRLDEPSDRAYGAAIGSRYNSQRLVLLPRQFKQPASAAPQLWPGDAAPAAAVRRGRR